MQARKCVDLSTKENGAGIRWKSHFDTESWYHQCIYPTGSHSLKPCMRPSSRVLTRGQSPARDKERRGSVKLHRKRYHGLFPLRHSPSSPHTRELL